MKTFISIFLSILILLLSCSSETDQNDRDLTVISYNVQNLFDDLEVGTEYPEFKKYSGWSSELYNKRLSLFQKLFKKEHYSDADIIILEEVESKEVLSALLDSGLRRRGFIYYGIVEDENPISVGYISKISMKTVTLHKTGDQRTLLCLEIMKNDMQLVIVALHAKSNVGDDDEAREKRKEYARHILFLSEYYERVPLIIIGDFNTEPRTDTQDMLSDVACTKVEVALSEGSVPITGEIEKADGFVLYDPSYDNYMPLSSDGSYYYNGHWYIYDRALVNRCLIDSTVDISFDILGDDTASTYGTPLPFDRITGVGYSDHFAVKLKISF